jgi:uncharacterized protein with ACT and thioredoxin-like domain
MPGSIPEAADPVVSDPVQCGVMAVMAVKRDYRSNQSCSYLRRLRTPKLYHPRHAN